MTHARQQGRKGRTRWWPRLVLGVVILAPAASIAVYARLQDPSRLTGAAPAPSEEARRDGAASRVGESESKRGGVEPDAGLERGVAEPGAPDPGASASEATETPAGPCAATPACREDGMCRLLEDDLGPRCGAESHADCAATALCREQGRCRFAPTGFGGVGRCVATELVRTQRFPLSVKRHGVQGELLVLVDPASAARSPRSARGYWPDADAPRAGAALTLRDARGAVLDEHTLYPDVSVQIEDLGAGTDTFLATEHVSCPEGHWCGPRTVFFEVRGGRLSAIFALGPRGEERPMVAVASRGARWKLERRARRGPRDLLVQLESFVPPGPALLETRFSFSRGRYRFTERRWPEFLPKNAKQPGPWNGALGLHDEPPSGH